MGCCHSKSVVVDEEPTSKPPIPVVKQEEQVVARETKMSNSMKTGKTADGEKYVNEFVLVKSLGQGSFGKVKLAVNKQTNEKVAIKMFSKRTLRRKKVGKSTALDDVQREIAIMRKLAHPNVVNLYEAIDDDQGDHLFMVLEYVDGGPVQKSAMENLQPMPEEQARNYFRNMISGLRYCHAQGIIHRDLKPENLLVTCDGTLKISDFGVSHIFSGDQGDQLERTAGTHAFMAPEIVTESNYSGKAIDIWAAGVCLFSFIFGCLPFTADNVIDMYRIIREDPVFFPHPVQENLGDLLCGLLEKSPEKRIKMDEIAKHPWVTRDGKEPLLEPKRNAKVKVTKNDMRNAVRKIQYIRFIQQAARRASKAALSIGGAVKRRMSREVSSGTDGTADSAETRTGDFTIAEENEATSSSRQGSQHTLDMMIPKKEIDNAWESGKQETSKDFDIMADTSSSDSSSGLIMDDSSDEDSSALVLDSSGSEASSVVEFGADGGGEEEEEDAGEGEEAGLMDDTSDEWDDEIIAIHGGSDDEGVGAATPEPRRSSAELRELTRNSSWLNSGPAYVPSDSEDDENEPRVISGDEDDEYEPEYGDDEEIQEEQGTKDGVKT